MDGKEAVWARAESFRKQYLRGELAHLPVDVITLVELELGLDLIPFDDLYARFQVDAALTADFSGIYVDAESYLLIETTRQWKMNRLRFSLAHELGHWVMHRGFFETHGFHQSIDFIPWTQQCGGQKYELEQQANEFAGRLLVPRDRLEAMYYDLASHFNESMPRDWRQDPDIRSRAAERVAETFGVHPKAIETRLSREGIWPEPF